MKKLLILGASLLTVLTLVNCGGGGNGGQGGSSSSGTSSSQSSQTSSRKPYTYKEVGTKTETSIEVKFYVNLPGDNGLYRLYHVEPGSKIETFRCVISGYYGSGWYYDQLGTMEFDFENTVITEELSLYGYPLVRKYEPGVSDWPIEEKDYTITWTVAENLSYVKADNGVLPKTADLNETVEFKLAYSLTAVEESVVTVNGETVEPNEEGVYSFVVTGNITVAATDAEYFNPIEGKKITYTFTNIPEEVLGTANQISIWSWGGADGWSVGTVDYANRTATFEISEFNTGFLFTVYAPGAANNSWENTLYKTSDLAFTAGVTEYDASEYFVTSGTGGSTEIPTSGYALVINGNSYVALTKNNAYNGKGEEWYATGVQINAGDVVTMYNATAGEHFVIKTPDNWSAGSWTGGNNGITCNESGVYNIYCKLIYQNDNIYFGK